MKKQLDGLRPDEAAGLLVIGLGIIACGLFLAAVVLFAMLIKS